MIFVAGMTLAACSAISPPEPRPRRAPDAPPNILVILVDDLGYNDLGFNGATGIETPNIDRLAGEGVIFTNGYVASPACAPSRAGLMTGRYPARFGLERNLAHAPFDHQLGLPVEEETFVTGLQRAGYRTGMVGKWHLGAAPPFHPLRRGFDTFQGFLAGGHDYFNVDASLSPPNEYLMPLEQDRVPAGFSGYLTDALTDHAIKFVRDAGETPLQEPFFLYLSYNTPHVPLQAPEELLEKYQDIEDWRRRAYLAMVDSLDQNLGRLRAALEETGTWEHTLTFFLSDNGGVAQGWADNSPLRAGKGSLYEGGIRVPFVATWPAGWPAGQRFEPMVISLDIAATALALAGVTPDPTLPLDGVSLDPFVRGEAESVPHEALFWRNIITDRSHTVFAVRSADMKLVQAGRHEEVALYNLAADPGETRDLTLQDPDTAARLAGLWNDWNAQNATNFVIQQTSYWLAIREAARRIHEDAIQWGSAVPPFQLATPVPDSALWHLPEPPANLSVKREDGVLVLRWSGPVPGIIGYQFRVQGLPDEEQWRPWRDIAYSGPSSVSYPLAGLAGDSYRVQLRAWNHAGAGQASEVAIYNAPPADRSTDPLTLPGDTTDDEGRITLTWRPLADAIAYQFRLRSLWDEDWRPWRDITGSGSGTHIIHGLSPETWYNVQLRARVADGSFQSVDFTTGAETAPS